MHCFYVASLDKIVDWSGCSKINTRALVRKRFLRSLCEGFKIKNAWLERNVHFKDRENI